MKTIAVAAAASLMSFVPAHCQPTAPAPDAHQSAYGVSLNAQPACAVFSARLWNSNNTWRTARIKVDGYDHSILHAGPDNFAEDTIYFPNGSGEHTVTVFWAGGSDTWRVPTDCAP